MDINDGRKGNNGTSNRRKISLPLMDLLVVGVEHITSWYDTGLRQETFDVYHFTYMYGNKAVSHLTMMGRN